MEQLWNEQLLNGAAVQSKLVKLNSVFSSEIIVWLALVFGPNTDDTLVIFSLVGNSYKKSKTNPRHFCMHVPTSFPYNPKD